MKLSDIAQEIQAKLHGQDMILPEISIDSRKILPGELFLALKGENHDGHDYIAASILNGASAIIGARAPITEQEKSVTFLQVKDTLIALGEIASMFRRLYPIPMVGLTGSCGKTSVKGMIESICQQQGKTLATKGNLNNHIGLPLTLLRLDETFHFAVIEMGASHQGEIQYLGGIARPTITLVTNVRPAHLLGFGSLANIASAKGEIYEILPESGVAIINNEEPYKTAWLERIKGRRVITFGLSKESMIFASDIIYQPSKVQFILHIEDKQQPITMNIPGQHTVMNALAATSAAFALEIPLERIVAGLQSFQGVPGRLRGFKGIHGAWVIDDSYNANPGSVHAALEVLANYHGNRIFVMGDMAELGENADDYHMQIGQIARQKGIDRLLAVGKLTENTVKAFGEGATFYPTKEALVADLKNNLTSQSVILIKGSRSAKMEAVTSALTSHEEAV
ncbi:MAG: UDP-N-acetylmuramoyl-tripeptide--D-alanyl-D-alanine ligase [Proteobacteria bacterium]|nr:UDP-N-acetylmuramoyl-tripeptide--D-alanyl-D-alanine ligase [Pseudomonadota bacterium]